MGLQDKVYSAASFLLSSTAQALSHQSNHLAKTCYQFSSLCERVKTIVDMMTAGFCLCTHAAGRKSGERSGSHDSSPHDFILAQKISCQA